MPPSYLTGKVRVYLIGVISILLREGRLRRQARQGDDHSCRPLGVSACGIHLEFSSRI